MYENLCGNVEGGIVIAPRRDVYQSSAKREKEIVESREKNKKEQDELQKVFITSNVYDYLMDATTRKGCENDRYVLFVLYVLIERYRKRYGEDNDYIRLYKRFKAKNKFTPATIDGWIDTKITSKALDRLKGMDISSVKSYRNMIKFICLTFHRSRAKNYLFPNL